MEFLILPRNQEATYGLVADGTVGANKNSIKIMEIIRINIVRLILITIVKSRKDIPVLTYVSATILFVLRIW